MTNFPRNCEEISRIWAQLGPGTDTNSNFTRHVLRQSPLFSNHEVSECTWCDVITSCKSNRNVSEVLRQLRAVKYFSCTCEWGVEQELNRNNNCPRKPTCPQVAAIDASSSPPRRDGRGGRERCWVSKLAHVTISSGPRGRGTFRPAGPWSSTSRPVHNWAKIARLFYLFNNNLFAIWKIITSI